MNDLNKKNEMKHTTMETIKHSFYMMILVTIFFLLLGILNVVQEVKGQTIKKVDEKKNALSQADEAAEAFARVMSNENSDVFLSLLKDSSCAVVFPSVSEADYLEIKDGRRGMASCRVDNAWGASVFVVLKTDIVNKER